jgi:hypothetical protein
LACRIRWLPNRASDRWRFTAGQPASQNVKTVWMRAAMLSESNTGSANSESMLASLTGTQAKELSQYQLDNFELLVVFDNRKVAYMVAFGLLWFGIGIASGLAFAHQASHV